jgi:SAM-dependent methyltransferase
MMQTPTSARHLDWAGAAQWYDENADSFEMATLALDVSEVMSDFLDGVPPGSRILDAGCGAGRDACKFLDAGFEVGAFDASAEMVSATWANTRGRGDIRHISFADFNDPADSWDAIWAMASLIHLPLKEITPTLERLLASLSPKGRLYFCIKEGTGEGLDARGRPMTSLDEETACEHAAAALPEGGALTVWTTTSPASSGQETRWINFLLYPNPEEDAV